MSPLVGAACAAVVVDTRVKLAGVVVPVGLLIIKVPSPPVAV